MCCAELQGVLADCNEWRIVAAKSSDKNITLLQEGSFANAQGSRFLGQYVQIWAALSSTKIDLLLLSNRVFRLRIVQKWGVLSPQCLIC